MPWKPATTRVLPSSRSRAHERGIHVEDAAAGVRAGGVDARLAAGDGGRVHADLLQRHGDQGDRLLLAGGQQDVEFAFARVFREVLGHLDQAVGHAGHGGNHGDDLVALVAGAFDPRGDVADAVERADGGAAVFLNDEGHGWSGGSEGERRRIGKEIEAREIISAAGSPRMRVSNFSPAFLTVLFSSVTFPILNKNPCL